MVTAGAKNYGLVDQRSRVPEPPHGATAHSLVGHETVSQPFGLFLYFFLTAHINAGRRRIFNSLIAARGTQHHGLIEGSKPYGQCEG